MLEITNILCPIDFSEFSYQALEVGKEFALKFGATIHVMHVVRPEVDPIVPPSATQFEERSSTEKRIKKARSRLKEELGRLLPGELQVKTHVLGGDPAHEILHFIESNENIEMAVIATHGRSGLSRFIFGSVTERVVRHARCEVLAVRSFEGRLTGKIG